MSEERNEVRLDKKLLVNIDQEGLESMGLTTNVSRTGMSVATSEALAVNSKVSLQLGVADETFLLKGEVMWSKENADGGEGDTNILTGIKITDAPGPYVKFVEKLLAG